MSTSVQTINHTAQRRKTVQFLFLTLPGTGWLVLFLFIPLLIMLYYSFLERGARSGVVYGTFTLEHYINIFEPTSRGQYIYLELFWRSLVASLATTVFCLLIGYPLAFFIATRQSTWKNVFLLLVVIPFWTNFLVRTYALITIMRNEGVINTMLDSTGVLPTLGNLGLPIETETLEENGEEVEFNYVQILNTPFAVILGLVYSYLPFMVLPIYATVERFNFRLVEAAHDLGANDRKAFFRVVLPGTIAGVVAGCILVFIPTIGSLITPELLGGVSTPMIGPVIQNQFGSARNPAFGSAISILMMLVVIGALVIYFRLSEDARVI